MTQSTPENTTEVNVENAENVNLPPTAQNDVVADESTAQNDPNGEQTDNPSDPPRTA